MARRRLLLAMDVTVKEKGREEERDKIKKGEGRHE
jgi:hypothetical protein